MTELEKVSRGLKCCIKGYRTVICSEECPYYEEESYCERKMMRDALALLQEQAKMIEVLKAMGLQMPETLVLTDEPMYKINPEMMKHAHIAGKYSD